ncbi:hypothetical protein KC573_00180 [candidate division WWE3 bacterium]|uniref:Uncharacterized protein n=1 Tax=candidate division WWE3 bacterium TaxID=2053526 RepID=A0A955LV08_UNCKA|nr:hypothetical protein [candidate division WWE3 bacterium]
MGLRPTQIFFGNELSLTEAEAMMTQTKPIRLLISASKDGFAIAWRVTPPIKIAWAASLQGPFYLATIKPFSGKRAGRGSQDPVNKLFRFLNKFPDMSLIIAMKGILTGAEPRVDAIPHVKIEADIIELAKYMGLSPYTILEYMLEAAQTAYIPLEQLTIDLGLGRDVAKNIVDITELIELWKSVQIALQDAARKANLITPYEVAVALGLGGHLDKNAHLEELVQLLRDEL